MQTFDQSLMSLFTQGRITKEEALNYCSNVRDFQLRLAGIVSGDWREKEARETKETSRADQIQQALDSEQGGESKIVLEGLAPVASEEAHEA